MAFVLVVFAIFRVFSKNIEARRAENEKWLKFENSVKGFFKFQNDKFKQRKTKVKISKLKKKKKYYVRVRAYKSVSGKKVYGAWSKVKTVKTK